MPFVYIEKVLYLWVQLMKNGGKNKSVAFNNFVQNICLFIIFIFFDEYIFTFYMQYKLVYVQEG